MCLLNIPFQIQSTFAVLITSDLLGSLSTRFWSVGFMIIQSQRTLERPGVQSASHRCLLGIRSLCRKHSYNMCSWILFCDQHQDHCLAGTGLGLLMKRNLNLGTAYKDNLYNCVLTHLWQQFEH